MNKAKLRKTVKDNLNHIVVKMNEVLAGENINKLHPVLARLGRGKKTPHWYEQLHEKGTLPNLDGKTIGSIIEMLFVGILENEIFKGEEIGHLNINPARGVDIPDLDLGIKSPSENYCTSEPFFSAYERLLGNEHDAIILLTDYQTAKKKPPLKVSIIQSSYLYGSEIADKNLCNIARQHRDWLIDNNETWAKKVFRFLAYVNQSDWRARHILNLIRDLQNIDDVENKLRIAYADFKKQNEKKSKNNCELIPQNELDSIMRIKSIKPLYLGIITTADDWVAEVNKDFGRLPNENEWERLKASPLNGKIGMSYALQWRYNFGLLFRNDSDGEKDDIKIEY